MAMLSEEFRDDVQWWVFAQCQKNPDVACGLVNNEEV
jgi:hypothetical protein